MKQKLNQWVGLIALSFLSQSIQAQTVMVSGLCIADTIELSVDPGSPLNGKVWYSGSGNVLGFPGVSVDLYWESTDTSWYLAFDGQPYFKNTEDSPVPPSTEQGAWMETPDNMDCLTGAELSVTGSGTVATRETGVADKFQLFQNRPNPFGAHTIAGFVLPGNGEVTLSVFDLRGNLILTSNRYFFAGYHEIAIDMTARDPGLYYYELSSPFGLRTEKMVVSR